MSLFAITGYDQSGQEVQLSLEGQSEQEVTEKARSVGIYASSIQRLDSPGWHNPLLGPRLLLAGSLVTLALVALVTSGTISALVDRVRPWMPGVPAPASPESSSSLVSASRSSELPPRQPQPAVPEIGRPATDVKLEESNYEMTIWFNVDLDLSKLPANARAVKGEVQIADLSGQVRLRIDWTLEPPLTPGRKSLQFKADPANEAHRWVFETDKDQMQTSFVVHEILTEDEGVQARAAEPGVSAPPSQPSHVESGVGAMYRFRPGEVAKYQMDTLSSQMVSSYKVGQAGFESIQEQSSVFRVHLTQKVLEVDAQSVVTLELTYDNVVAKQTVDGQEQVLDTSLLVGSKFTARISSKGRLLDLQGVGDLEQYEDLIRKLFIVLPDEQLRSGVHWRHARDSQATEPATGLQLAQTNTLDYRVQDVRARDTFLVSVAETIDQQLTVRTDAPQDGVRSAGGKGTGSGSGKGSRRLDARTLQLVLLEETTMVRNTLTVDEETLVGATVRTRYSTELTTTTTIRRQ